MTRKEQPALLSTADALRHEGYIPLPRLWVKKEDMTKIIDIASQYATNVNKLRKKVQALNKAMMKEAAPPVPTGPVFSKEAAWEAHEKMKRNK
jgi:AmiR/NasT family two-component response regulator